MTHRELVRSMASDLGITLRDAAAAAHAFVRAVALGLHRDGIVRVQAFGRFRQQIRRGQSGRDFKTGEAITTRPYVQVRFSLARAMREALGRRL